MPSSTLLALHRRRRRRRAVTVTLPLSAFRLLRSPSRDWAGMPPELVSSILHRSDPVQIMLGADKVCRSWRRAALDEPELWRRIDMRGYEELAHRSLADLDQMAVDAVLRSRGQCQAFAGGRASVSDGFLRFLADHIYLCWAPALKSLILISCGEKLSNEGLLEVIQMFPQLEELEVSKCWNVRRNKELFEVVSKACPHLKHLRHSHPSFIYCHCCTLPDGDDSEAMVIAKMHGIRSLQFVRNILTNQGLVAILDNCPHLESLEIRRCCNIIIDDALRAKCAHIKSLTLVPFGPTSKKLEPEPISECFTCLDYFENNSRERHRKGINDEEHMVVAIVRELRSLELYHNDLTSQGRAAILKKFPQLESSDIHSCRNIIMNNAITRSNILRGNKYRWWITETKKLTTKLLRDKFSFIEFDPEGLAQGFYDTYMKYIFGSKYSCTDVIRKKIKNYHRKARQRVKGNFYYKEFYHQELDPHSPVLECSNCVMFEYFAKIWEELDLDDYSDYDDSWYGFDSHDEIDFHVHDKIVGKRFQRYLKMESK
ncbi:unnamed protein product [Urochloa decumbens]|uniref:F-box domain-containing protein n=1 Tax=Urochloa decumbens TaxID=240449 RepID=A0ABC9FR35_9POAL